MPTRPRPGRSGARRPTPAGRPTRPAASTEPRRMPCRRPAPLPPHLTPVHRIWRQCALTLALAAATALAGCATAHGGVTSRATPKSRSSTAVDGRVLPVYRKDGQAWVVGTPGREYSVRIRSINGGRLLAVTSVDGVNVISGETASPAQSGYVLDPYGSRRDRRLAQEPRAHRRVLLHRAAGQLRRAHRAARQRRRHRRRGVPRAHSAGAGQDRPVARQRNSTAPTRLPRIRRPSAARRDAAAGG